jgi:lysozyme family protein
MQSAFEWAASLVLDQSIEGGLVDNPADPGGITNHGISLRFASTVEDLNGDGRPDLDIDGDGDIDADDIRKLTVEQARDVFRHYFWRLLRCDELPVGLALLVFDAGINQGRGPAIVMLQEALGIKADGKIGPVTLAAAVAAAGRPSFIDEYAARRAHRYSTTKNFEIFGLGWMRRLMKMHSTALAAEVG